MHENYNTINLLPNTLACLLYLFWACVVPPGCWIWPWFFPLACTISWLCHCGDTINLLHCHNVASSPFLPFQNPAAHVIHPLFQLLLLFTGLEYRQQELVEKISQPTFFSPCLPHLPHPQSGLGTSSVACFVPSSKLISAFSGFPWH